MCDIYITAPPTIVALLLSLSITMVWSALITLPSVISTSGMTRTVLMTIARGAPSALGSSSHRLSGSIKGPAILSFSFSLL